MNETKTAPICVSRMLPHGREYGGVWVIKQGKHTFYTRQYTHMNESLENPIKEFFNRDKSKGKTGWCKVTNTTKLDIIPAIPEGSIQTYQDAFDLIQKHGAEVAGLLMGFDAENYGDQYCLTELKMLAKYGQPMLDWLNKIAEVDGAIKAHLETEYNITFSNIGKHNQWMTSGEGDSFRCLSRVMPFLGQHIECRFMGIFIKEFPSIDPFGLDDSFKEVFLTFKRTGIKDHCEHCDAVLDWYENGRSIKDNLRDMIGNELAEWVCNNLSPKFILPEQQNS